jgi:hypothetical protein
MTFFEDMERLFFDSSLKGYTTNPGPGLRMGEYHQLAGYSMGK